MKTIYWSLIGLGIGLLVGARYKPALPKYITVAEAEAILDVIVIPLSVRDLQKSINRIGFAEVEEDGYFGSETRNALDVTVSMINGVIYCEKAGMK